MHKIALSTSDAPASLRFTFFALITNNFENMCGEIHLNFNENPREIVQHKNMLSNDDF